MTDLTTRLLLMLLGRLGKKNTTSEVQDATEDTNDADDPLNTILEKNLDIEDLLDGLNNLGVSDLNTVRDYIVDAVQDSLGELENLSTTDITQVITDWFSTNFGGIAWDQIVSPIVSWIVSNIQTYVNSPIQSWITSNIISLLSAGLSNIWNDNRTAIETLIKDKLNKIGEVMRAW